MAAVVPDAPSAPTASSVDETSITITWAELATENNGGSPVTDYRIYYAIGAASSTFNGNNYSSGTTSFTLSVTSGETYKFKIAALNYIGEGD